MKSCNFKRAYIWELPVRIFHWVNALAIVVLSVTGFIISNPPAILSNEDPTQIYWFGWVRYIHFVSAFIFVATIVMRFYWAFVGNKFANWSAYWPFTKERMHNLWYVMKVDVLLQDDEEHKLSNISIGHNVLAAAAYMFFFLLFIVMILTGFGLYAPTSQWWFPQLFSWVPSLLGGDFNTRMIHHGAMWIIILVAVIHVYLVFYHEWLEGRGEVSSMFSGYKFVRSERINEEETTS
jgi:Ni/Fe-hydrogenase 1 B-type cytochrome subunit